MPLHVVVVILVNNRTATVMAELRRRHRRALQVPAQIFYAVPGAMGLFGEVDLPVALILRLQVALPLFLIADMAGVGKLAGIDSSVAGTQQADDGAAPDGFNLLFFEEQLAPDAVFGIETAAGDGNVDVRMLIELPAVGVHVVSRAPFEAAARQYPNDAGALDDTYRTLKRIRYQLGGMTAGAGRISGHGYPFSVLANYGGSRAVDGAKLARLTAQYTAADESIRLTSCFGGLGGRISAGQLLANATGKTVRAASGYHTAATSSRDLNRVFQPLTGISRQASDITGVAVSGLARSSFQGRAVLYRAPLQVAQLGIVGTSMVLNPSRN